MNRIYILFTLFLLSQGICCAEINGCNKNFKQHEKFKDTVYENECFRIITSEDSSDELVTFYVDDGSMIFELTTVINLQSYKDRFNELRKKIDYNGKYLTINTWSGGNSIYSREMHVFKNDDKLYYLGSVSLISDDKKSFIKLESIANEITSHANIPVVKIILEEVNNKLFYSKKYTWLYNSVEFNKKYEKLLELSKKKKTTYDDSVYSELISLGATAKFCNNKNAYDNIINLSKKLYNGDKYKELIISLNDFNPKYEVFDLSITN